MQDVLQQPKDHHDRVLPAYNECKLVLKERSRGTQNQVKCTQTSILTAPRPAPKYRIYQHIYMQEPG